MTVSGGSWGEAPEYHSWHAEAVRRALTVYWLQNRFASYLKVCVKVVWTYTTCLPLCVCIKHTVGSLCTTHWCQACFKAGGQISRRMTSDAVRQSNFYRAWLFSLCNIRLQWVCDLSPVWLFYIQKRIILVSGQCCSSRCKDRRDKCEDSGDLYLNDLRHCLWWMFMTNSLELIINKS